MGAELTKQNQKAHNIFYKYAIELNYIDGLPIREN